MGGQQCLAHRFHRRRGGHGGFISAGLLGCWHGHFVARFSGPLIGYAGDQLLRLFRGQRNLCAICARRLFSRVAFNAKVMHFSLPTLQDRASYFFYLMARNEMRFWVENSQSVSRFRIRYRILQRSFKLTYRLRQAGLDAKASTCLPGTWDGLWKRGGPPVLDRRVPWLMKLLYAVSVSRGVPA
jgi:hypothetical protein